jgi:hypothetical protein
MTLRDLLNPTLGAGRTPRGVSFCFVTGKNGPLHVINPVH